MGRLRTHAAAMRIAAIVSISGKRMATTKKSTWKR
jgi:hypothetical protein